MKQPSPVPVTLDRKGLEASSMVRQLQSHGHEAYFAGGCVRDLMLGRTPHDYDIATQASPEQILAIFTDAKAVGRAFPVVRLTRRNRVVDIASFRQEGIYLDGRHPSTTAPGTLEQDAQRRDFTINALYLDPCTGSIVDFVDGLADISQRKLRFVGEPAQRLEEDHLRLMRAVRFASTLGFDIDTPTWEAVKSHAPRLARISLDRIRDELERCLTEARHPAEALDLLATAGLLTVIFPGQTFEPIRLAHVRDLFERVETKIPELMLAILLHRHEDKPAQDKQQPDIRTTLDGLRFSNEFSAVTTRTISLQETISRITLTDIVQIRHLIADPCFPLALELHRLECRLSGQSVSIAEQLVIQRNRLSQFDWLPAPWVTGDDLKVLGLAPGPLLAHWKKLAHDQQLRGLCPDRATLLNWVQAAIQAAT